MTVPDAALAWARNPALGWLWAAARERVDVNGGVGGTMVLHDLAPEELAALGGLLGARWRPSADGEVRLKVDRLDRALRVSAFGIGLEQLLEALGGGPLPSRPAERAAARAASVRGWAAAREHAAVRRHPGLALWLDEVRGKGLHTRVAGKAAGDRWLLLQAALDVVGELPADPPEGLPAFAARVTATDDSHALDRGTALNALVVSALITLSPKAVEATARSAAARRAAYAAFGVACDELSVDVLVCGLRPAGRSYLARSLRAAADEGEPRRLTYRELRTCTDLRVGGAVFVCENPEVVAAAAARLGSVCPPLVCTEGWPSTACLRLLDAVCASGARLGVRADIDAAGLRIAALLLSRYQGAQAWRMDTGTYDATAGALRWPGTLPADDGRWPELVARIRERRRVQLEEHVLDLLLDDLAIAVRGAGGVIA